MQDERAGCKIVGNKEVVRVLHLTEWRKDAVRVVQPHGRSFWRHQGQRPSSSLAPLLTTTRLRLVTDRQE
jgi:hypothetical protein